MTDLLIDWLIDYRLIDRCKGWMWAGSPGDLLDVQAARRTWSSPSSRLFWATWFLHHHHGTSRSMQRSLRFYHRFESNPLPFSVSVKGTVDVNSRKSPFIEWHVRFPMIPFSPLSKMGNISTFSFSISFTYNDKLNEKLNIFRHQNMDNLFIFLKQRFLKGIGQTTI